MNSCVAAAILLSCLVLIVGTIPINNVDDEESKRENFVKPFQYVTDNVRDKRRVVFQDDALDLYSDNGEEMADFILPSNGEEGTSYADEGVLLDDSKLDEADEGTTASESESGATTSSGNEEGSTTEIESGMLVNEASNQLVVDNDEGMKNETLTEKEGNKRSSTCCLIE